MNLTLNLIFCNKYQLIYYSNEVSIYQYLKPAYIVNIIYNIYISFTAIPAFPVSLTWNLTFVNQNLTYSNNFIIDNSNLLITCGKLYAYSFVNSTNVTLSQNFNSSKTSFNISFSTNGTYISIA